MSCRLRHALLKCTVAVLWWDLLMVCHARNVVICTMADHKGYAAQTSLFDFEEAKIQMAWFETASLIPLPETGGCDVARLPAHEATSYILRGVDLQIYSMRIQLRRYFQLVARLYVKSPLKLLGKTVAVYQSSEMHVFLLRVMDEFALPYRLVSKQEHLDGAAGRSEETVTVVLCDDIVHVEALYSAELVDAQVIPPGGVDDGAKPSKVLLTTEELHHWDAKFSLLMVTTRKWAQDPANLHVLQYFTAVAEVYDAHYARQPFEASSPEVSYMVQGRLGMLGNAIVGGEIQGVPLRTQQLIATNLAANTPSYYYFDSGDRFWEDRMRQMVDKTIVSELVANSELFYAKGWSTRRAEAAELERHLDLRVYDGLEAVIRMVNQTFNWTLGQTPGERRPRLPFGSWNNWPPPEQANYCSGVVELPSNAPGTFSDGHIGSGQYAPNSTCDWVLLPPTSDAPGQSSAVLVEFPLLFLEPMSKKDTVQVVDPRAPHRLLAHFRGQVIGGAVRHAGPLTVKFRSDMIRRVNMMELEMGLNAQYSRLGCAEDARGCGVGTCGDDGVCVCPEGRAGVDCSLEHCLGTNVYELQPGESVELRSNVAAAYAPFADCRWEVHPPAECALCVVDVVFSSLQTELGRDAVEVAAAPSGKPFWWEHPPDGAVMYSRSDLNASGMHVRGQQGMAVFVRLHSDEVVEAAGFEATARVLDPAEAPEGASTFNCYDAQGGLACSGRGLCVPGSADGELGQCTCDPGYFGSTCEEEVCNMVNVAPTLPTWRLARTSTTPLIARFSECRWAVAPAPLAGNGTRTLPAHSVRVSVQEWEFDGALNNELLLSAPTREVKLQTNRCVSGLVCPLEAQCSSREGRCNWTATRDVLEMPPEFNLTLRVGINSKRFDVALVVQATFFTPSGHVVVAEAAHPASVACEPKEGQTTTSLVFDFSAMDCLPPPAALTVAEGDEGSSMDYRIVTVLAPVIAVLTVVAVVLVYQNRTLSHVLTDLRDERARIILQGPNLDLDSPLIKVTEFLAIAAKKQPFLARWLLPKNDMAQQAQKLKAMLLESENVNRPKIDMHHLQDDYGQDIVDFLLASTCTREKNIEDALEGIRLDAHRAATSDSECSSQISGSDSMQPYNPYKAMMEEEVALLAGAGTSYDVDLSHLCTIQVKGTLCFVGIKVMERWDLMKSLKISRTKMASYLLAVEDGYLDNPYHNVYHAADVTNRMATMLTKSGLAEHLEKTREGRVQLLGAVLAAAIHDYGHPGTNNAYAVKTGQLYAKIYNDQAVYENSALYQAFSLADDAELDFGARFSKDTKRQLRVTIIELVLATDMSRHFDLVTLVKAKVGSAVPRTVVHHASTVAEPALSRVSSKRRAEGPFAPNGGIEFNDLSSEQMSLMLKLALKVADIGHCMLPLDEHKFWVQNLELEFFKQGDLEKQGSLPISPLMDRDKPGPTNGGNQAGFFEVIVMPTISLWQTLCPGSANQLQQQALSNLIFWKNSAHFDQPSEDADVVRSISAES